MRYSDRILQTPPSFVRSILASAQNPEVISFAGGLPNPVSFPIEQIETSTDRAIKEHGSKLFQYATTQGYDPLRQYIADKYNAQHNLSLTADDVLITTGSQQALDLIGKAVLNKGDGVIVEEPGYLGAIQSFSMYQPQFHPVTLEQDGIDITKLEETLNQNDIKLFYSVPNFQNPSGLTYSLDKRLKVREALKGKSVLLIEDDPYGELRFRGEKLPYIGAEMPEDSIMLGSFSKTVAPGMRLGFLITRNRELMKYICISKEASDLHTNIFSQYVIYDYLVNNDYQEHIRSIIALYKEQSGVMLDAMETYFPKDIHYTRPDGGMFIWATLQEGRSALELFPKAMEQNVAFVPGDPFYTGKTNVNTMRLNYTNTTPDVILEGIKRLGSLL